MNGQLTAADFAANGVINPAQSEIIRNRLYDFLLYPAAGTTQLTFFSLPVGQGITSAQGATVGSAKTLSDTNMQLGGQLPNGQMYVVESIEVLFLPGSTSTANTYTPAAVYSFAAVAAAAVGAAVNDVNLILQTGQLDFNILNKNYLREPMLMAFPPKAMIDVSAAIGNNSATTSVNVSQIAKAVGRPYYIDPKISIRPAVNFEVKLSWPGAVAPTSGFNGRIGVLFDGGFMRASQ
jgi:hypothetical protein